WRWRVPRAPSPEPNRPTIGRVSRRSAVALAVLAVAAAAAITVPLIVLGGGAPHLTKEQYSQRVSAIYEALGESFVRAGAWRSAAEASASLRAMKAALDRAATALASLRPPSDVERDHRALVSSTRDYAEQ